MLFTVYIDREGYIGDVSAPDREKAVDFLIEQGYHLDDIELREINE
jgi:hypothetical protein